MEKKITFIGDMLCTPQIMQRSEKPEGGWDFDSIFIGPKRVFADSDLVIGNLETPIAGVESGFTKRIFSFNAPVEYAQAVKNMGVGFVSTANNHTNDRGVKGIKGTCKNLQAIGLRYSGTHMSCFERHGQIIDVGGVRIGVMCYASHTNKLLDTPFRIDFLQDRKPIFLFQHSIKSVLKTCKTSISRILLTLRGKKYDKFAEPAPKFRVTPGTPHDCDMSPRRYNTKGRKRQIIKEIARMRNEGAEIIVMYAHAGGQYNVKPEKAVVEYANWLLDQGVNAVVINHEHLVQEADFSKLSEKNQFIAYCLGNFLAGSGVIAPPMGKLSEYSAMTHMYVDEETKRIRCTVGFLKTGLDSEGRFIVMPVYELIKACRDEEEKARLVADNLKLYNIFMKTEKTFVENLKEYPCEG